MRRKKNPVLERELIRPGPKQPDAAFPEGFFLPNSIIKAPASFLGKAPVEETSGPGAEESRNLALDQMSG
jgi:hypothetical protein